MLERQQSQEINIDQASVVTLYFISGENQMP